MAIYDELVGKLRDEYQLDLSEVNNANDLANAFESLVEGTRPSSKGNLSNNADKIFANSDVVQDAVVQNAISTIDDSDNIEEANNALQQVGDITSARRNSIERRLAAREVELASEKGVDLTREELLDLGVQGTSLTKSASRVGVGEGDFREALEREGFSVTDRGIIKK